MMRFSLCIALFAAWAAPSAADLQTDAEAALTADRPGEAIAITDEILATTPADFPALFVKAAALSDLGRYKNAAQAAGAAFRAAQNDAERLQAARLASSAHFRAREYTRAEWWLRRASNHVSTPEEAANLFTEFQAVRRENPLGVRLNFGVAPSNNINGGSDNPDFDRATNIGVIDFFLPEERRPQSGIEYAADVQLSYRLSQSDQQVTTIGGYLYGRTYTPSKSAREAIPGISGNDYALGLIDASLRHRRVLFPRAGATDVSIHAGRLTYGGDPFWNYSKINLAQDFAVSPNSSAFLQTAYEVRNGIAGRQADTRIYDLNMGFRTRLVNDDAIQISFSNRWYDTDAVEASYNEYQLGLNYGFGRPFYGINWSTSLGVGRTEYDVFFDSLSGRQDDFVFGGGSATWTDVSYFGFSPRIDLSARRSRSDVEQYSTSSVQIRFGLESNF